MRTITISGSKLPFHLSYRALKGALLDTGLSMDNIGSLNFEHIAKFGKNAINSGYKFNNEDTKISLDEIEDLLDKDFSGITAIAEAIQEEMKVINGEVSEEGDTEKK